VKELLERGTLLDFAVAVVVLEATMIALLRARRGAGLRLRDVAGQLLAGVFLLLALRNALAGGDYRLTLGFMTLSFPAHAWDLVRRAVSAP
jgi:hypothetical protein